MLSSVKRVFILSLRLQSLAIWFYAFGTMVMVSSVYNFCLVWALCFILQIWSRIMQSKMPFSVWDFHVWWLALNLLDCGLVLGSDFKKLKKQIVFRFSWDIELSIPYKWNFLTRWANTPLLIQYLTELGFREISVGIPNIILDMSFGRLTEPSWIDVWNYVAGGQVWGEKVQVVSLDNLNYFKDCLNTFEEIKWLLISVVLASMLNIGVQEFYYGAYSINSEPWVLVQIVWIPTMILTILAYIRGICIGVFIPLLMAYQNYKGWRQNSLGMALWDIAVGITHALLTKLLSCVYNYLVFGSRLSLNWMFLFLLPVTCLLLVATLRYKISAQYWSW